MPRYLVSLPNQPSLWKRKSEISQPQAEKANGSGDGECASNVPPDVGRLIQKHVRRIVLHGIELDALQIILELTQQIGRHIHIRRRFDVHLAQHGARYCRNSRQRKVRQMHATRKPGSRGRLGITLSTFHHVLGAHGVGKCHQCGDRKM